MGFLSIDTFASTLVTLLRLKTFFKCKHFLRGYINHDVYWFAMKPVNFGFYTYGTDLSQKLGVILSPDYTVNEDFYNYVERMTTKFCITDFEKECAHVNKGRLVLTTTKQSPRTQFYYYVSFMRRRYRKLFLYCDKEHLLYLYMKNIECPNIKEVLEEVLKHKVEYGEITPLTFLNDLVDIDLFVTKQIWIRHMRALPYAKGWLYDY